LIEKLSELDLKQQLMVMILIVLVTVAAFSFILFRPKLTQLTQLMNEEAQASQKIRATRLTLLRLQSAKKQASEINQRLARAKEILPAEGDIPSIILEIQDIANQAGIEFVSIKPGSLIPNDGYAELPLDIVIDGYFYDLVDFLYRLEKMKRATKVSKIRIVEGKKKLPNIQTTISGSVFVLAPPAPPQPKQGAPGAKPGAQTPQPVPAQP
jgi:type IV pilus assembly protein PilO